MKVALRGLLTAYAPHCGGVGAWGRGSHGYQLEIDSNRDRSGVGSGSEDASAD